jgi:hypothetical protein
VVVGDGERKRKGKRKGMQNRNVGTKKGKNENVGERS